MTERSRTRPPIGWIFWHPHQKLWNWRLEAGLRRVGRPLGIDGRLSAMLVAIDSWLLLAGVLVRRTFAFGPRAAGRMLDHIPRPVLYIDCGVHKEGIQIRAMHQWFGDHSSLQVLAFEAGGDHCADARANLTDIPNVDLRHAALVGPAEDRPFIELYKGARGGKADSVFGWEGAEVELVPAVRLSEVLATEYSQAVSESVVLLRMNIEGSEVQVIDDLIANNLHTRIDGFFGMWDDVGKRDVDRDRRFRRKLADAHIRTFTFNDRDAPHPRREQAIRLEVDTAVRSRSARPR